MSANRAEPAEPHAARIAEIEDIQHRIAKTYGWDLLGKHPLP